MSREKRTVSRPGVKATSRARNAAPSRWSTPLTTGRLCHADCIVQIS